MVTKKIRNVNIKRALTIDICELRIDHYIEQAERGQLTDYAQFAEWITAWLYVKRVKCYYPITIVDDITTVPDVPSSDSHGLTFPFKCEIYLGLKQTRLFTEKLDIDIPFDVILLVTAIHEARHSQQYEYAFDKYGLKINDTLKKAKDNIDYLQDVMEVDAMEYSQHILINQEYNRSLGDVINCAYKQIKDALALKPSKKI